MDVLLTPGWGALLFGVLVVVLITLATAYFVAQEFAYMAVDRSALSARAEDGDAGARSALAVTRRTSFMLSGAQLGITVTGLLVGYLAEPLIGESLAELLGFAGWSTAFSLGLGTAVALLFSTVVQMVLGELFPKNYAIARPEPVAVRLAWSTRRYLAIFGPLIKVFDAAAEALLRLLRIDPVHDVDHTADPRDLVKVVRDSSAAGDLPAGLSLLLERILDFPERTVAHALVPRSHVDTLDLDAGTVGDARKLMTAGHTRYPVSDRSDRIAGVVHLLDVLDPGLDDGAALSSVMREPLVVSEHGRLTDVLSRMLYERDQLACVVDESGTFIGVLTLEDLAEEIVGEITDEHDAREPDQVRAVAPGAWEVAGTAPLDEIERPIGQELPAGDFETLSGLLSHVYGALPELGAVIDIPAVHPAGVEPEPGPLRATVLLSEHYVPALVRLEQVPAEPVEETP